MLVGPLCELFGEAMLPGRCHQPSPIGTVPGKLPVLVMGYFCSEA